jgi:hypothetical protein
MRRHKRGLVSEDVIQWIVYVIMTGIVLALVRGLPLSIYSNAVDTASMENAIMNERVYVKIADHHPLTGRAHPGYLQNKEAWARHNILNSFETAGSPRKLAFKATIGHDPLYYNKPLYEDGKPLAPVRYKNFIEQRPVWLIQEQRFETLEIDQVYAPQVMS